MINSPDVAKSERRKCQGCRRWFPYYLVQTPVARKSGLKPLCPLCWEIRAPKISTGPIFARMLAAAREWVSLGRECVR